jgi:hypothetical protein
MVPRPSPNALVEVPCSVLNGSRRPRWLTSCFAYLAGESVTTSALALQVIAIESSSAVVIVLRRHRHRLHQRAERLKVRMNLVGSTRNDRAPGSGGAGRGCKCSRAAELPEAACCCRLHKLFSYRARRGAGASRSSIRSTPCSSWLPAARGIGRRIPVSVLALQTGGSRRHAGDETGEGRGGSNAEEFIRKPMSGPPTGLVP